MHYNQYLALLAFEALSASAAPAFSLPAGFPSLPKGAGASSSGSGSSPFSGLKGLGGFAGFGAGNGANSAGSTPGTGSSTPSTGVSGGGFSLGGLSGLAAGGGSNTENGITENAGCTALTVIFARGTSESGNVGTVAGPPFFSALRDSVGADQVTVQGVDYPASVQGNANLGADGGPTMSQLAAQSVSQCPDSKIVLSGYSQGGLVVHNAAGQSDFPASNIAGAVLFGDPFNGQAVDGIDQTNTLEICADGDDVCSGSGSFAITQAHLSYGQNAQQAADFAKQVAGV
ncbi:MAG: hypothetical protein Q9160_006061 [Pyrenula sp. 1 TL-2023]